MSQDDIFSHFSDLDELVQVIYQGFERFVLLSKVSDESWTIHLGLLGNEGRWWRGSCSEKDVLQTMGSAPAKKVLEAFADDLANAIRNGDLSIDGWNSSESADGNAKLILGSSKPFRVSLHELSHQEAASYATSVIFEVAKEARSRKCQLHPSPYVAPPPPPITNHHLTVPPTQPRPFALNPATTAAPPPGNAARAVPNASSKRSELKPETPEPADPAKQRKPSKLPPSGPSTGRPLSTQRTTGQTVKQPPKGASLANPNKKARKYQEVEFASDEE